MVSHANTRVIMMTLNKLKLLFAFLMIAMTATAQKSFTLEDLNFGGTNYRNMVPKKRWTTWWGNQLIHQDVEKCSVVDKKTGKEKTLFTLDEINKWAGSDDQKKVYYLSDTSFPYADKSLVLVTNKEERLLVDFKSHKVVWRQTTKDESFSDWNTTSKAVAYVTNDQFYVRDAEGNAHQLSTDGSRDIVYGQSVHRDEFGIYKGTFWSHKGNKLAFYRMDQSMVSDFPLVDNPENDWKPAEGQSRIATFAPTKYPMTGETSHKVTVGVYDLATGKTIYLKAGDPTDRYFTNIAWSPDDKTIYMFELNRDQNDCRLVSYDATTGDKTAELYRETDDKYVEPLHPIQFLPWDKSKFIMQSQKDGYNHLYLYNIEGQQLSQITTGKWVVLDVKGFDNKNKSVIYSSNECSPIQQNTWSVNVNTGKRTLLDNGKGWHYSYLSTDGQYLVDNYQEPTVPRAIEIINTQAKKRVTYFTADNPWEGYNVPAYSCGTIKAANDSTDLYWRMVKPVNFDPNKKYPTIIYVYGGPHAHNVDAGWHYGSRGWETYMAQAGYLLFILDNRGSENRGKEFEQVTFRQLGQAEMQDQMKGVEYLKSLPYVDADRIGVHGWSYGGYMTITLMTNHPEVFKVGVAGGPVIDWRWYEVMYGERYMDTPQSNPEGYAKTSLINQAKNLKGRLQIIIGENDATVVPQHARSFIHQCILDGTQPDYFIYPGEPHNMRGHQSTHLHERISRYFFDYLK